MNQSHIPQKNMAKDWKVRIMNTVRTRNTVLLEEMIASCSTPLLDFRFGTSPLSGSTPLTTAAEKRHYHIAGQLLRAGATVDYPDEHGFTPLMAAAYCHNIDLCKLFLSYGADVNATSELSITRTALHAAVISSSYKIATLLLKHGARCLDSEESSNATNKVSVIDCAMHFGNVNLLELFLDNVLQQGYTAPLESSFNKALELQDEDCAITILRKGYYPLQQFAQSPSTTLFQSATSKGFFQLVKLLIELDPLVLQEEWLVEKNLARKRMQKTDFTYQLCLRRTQPPRLKGLCRSRILVQLAPCYSLKIKELPLPKPLQTFLRCVELS